MREMEQIMDQEKQILGICSEVSLGLGGDAVDVTCAAFHQKLDHLRPFPDFFLSRNVDVDSLEFHLWCVCVRPLSTTGS